MKLNQPFSQREAWLACFFMGVIMLNFPFLEIFNKTTQVLGIPLLVLYFLVGWPVSIFVIYLFARCPGNGNGNGPTPPGEHRGLDQP